MVDRRQVLAGTGGLLTAVLVEESIRERVWGNDESAPFFAETTIWDIDDILEQEQESQQQHRINVADSVIDTVVDRRDEYRLEREACVEKADYLPDDEAQNPFVTPGDRFYDGKYLVSTNVLPEDATGERQRQSLPPYTHQNTLYTNLTDRGFQLVLPADPQEQEQDSQCDCPPAVEVATIAVECDTEYQPEELENLQQFYDQARESAQRAQQQEFNPKTSIERQSLSQLQQAVDQRLTAASEDSAEYQRLQEAKQQLTDAIDYFNERQQHYQSVSNLFQQVRETTSYDEGRVVCADTNESRQYTPDL